MRNMAAWLVATNFAAMRTAFAGDTYAKLCELRSFGVPMHAWLVMTNYASFVKYFTIGGVKGGGAVCEIFHKREIREIPHNFRSMRQGGRL